MNYLELWASTVLGAVLVYVGLSHLVPGINPWLLYPAGMAGAFIASEIQHRIVHKSSQLSKKDSLDS